MPLPGISSLSSVIWNHVTNQCGPFWWRQPSTHGPRRHFLVCSNIIDSNNFSSWKIHKLWQEPTAEGHPGTFSPATQFQRCFVTMATFCGCFQQTGAFWLPSWRLVNVMLVGSLSWWPFHALQTGTWVHPCCASLLKLFHYHAMHFKISINHSRLCLWLTTSCK